MTIIIYEFNLTDSVNVRTFRELLWRVICENYESYPSEFLKILNSYATNEIPQKSYTLLNFDLDKLIKIIEIHLRPDEFLDCLFIQRLRYWLKINKVVNQKIEVLESKFQNRLFEVYKKINWDRSMDRESNEFTSFQDYEELKEGEIRSKFKFMNLVQATEFYNNFTYLRDVVENNWNFNKAFDFIVDENCKENIVIGFHLLELVMDSNNSIEYLPWLIFRNNLNSRKNVNRIKTLISSREYRLKGQWLLRFYENVNNEIITVEDGLQVIKVVRCLEESLIIPFEMLNRYQIVDSSFYKNLLQTVKKVNSANNVKLKLWEEVYDKFFPLLGDDLDLIEKSYLQQVEFGEHFDYKNKGFKNILSKDRSFLIRYFNKIVKKDRYGFQYFDGKLGFVWEFQDIEHQLIVVYDSISNDGYSSGLFGDLHTTFFRNISPELEERADEFILSYTKANIKDANKVNMMVDIARTVRREVYEKMILLYLSLNQDENDFKKIWWRGNGGSYSGHVIIGDIKAAEWKNILSIVEKSDQGIKLIPIKRYLNGMIESCLQQGDWERQQRFLENRL